MRKTKSKTSMGNLEINKNSVKIFVDPKIYPINTVFFVLHDFTDKAYVTVDGSPDEQIILKMEPKDKKTDLENLGKTFNNELMNFALSALQMNRNLQVIEGALSTRVPVQESKTTETRQENELSYIEDPYKIAVPWEEKFGKKKKE